MEVIVKSKDNETSNQSISPPADYDEAEWGTLAFDTIEPGPIALTHAEELSLENQTYFYLTDHFLHRANFAVFVAFPLVFFVAFCFYGLVPNESILIWAFSVLLSDALILYNTRHYNPKNTSLALTIQIRRKTLLCFCLNAAAWGSSLFQLANLNYTFPSANFILFTCCAVVIAFASNVMATSILALSLFSGIISIFMMIYFGLHFGDYAIWLAGTLLLLISTIFIGSSNSKQIKEYLKVTALSELLAEKLIKNNAELHNLATVDGLTGANNRRWISEQIILHITEAKRYQQPLSIMLIDIDYFKRVNDTHGHEVGDQVLINIVTLLKNWLRDTDLMGRFGGEEFIILLPMTTAEEACILAERLRLNIAQNSAYKTQYNQDLTISIGIAGVKNGLTSKQEAPEKMMKNLINHADQALYTAKNNGRNRVELYAEAL